MKPSSVLFCFVFFISFDDTARDYGFKTQHKMFKYINFPTVDNIHCFSVFQHGVEFPSEVFIK